MSHPKHQDANDAPLLNAIIHNPLTTNPIWTEGLRAHRAQYQNLYLSRLLFFFFDTRIPRIIRFNPSTCIYFDALVLFSLSVMAYGVLFFGLAGELAT